MSKQTPTPAEIEKLANELLKKSGFNPDGTSKKCRKKSRKQKFFERRIIMTPMGNGSR